ncbi:GntR family transcriptional regulator [Falsiroseomonas sp. CW058]|uniref:GntR family transcriptional regulator n=1 Tax=Falsiroseomonas sp. CW058 TaxID=3388664 RepID=UPI003D31BA61
MTAPEAPAPHRSLRDHATRELRHALMTGRFEPGQRMTIRGLAEGFGMSMTPVREAVARLAAERAIEAEPNRWMRIPILTADELRELRDIRVALEGLATERAAARATPALLAELEAREAEIVALRRGGDAKARIAAINRLHFAIYRASAMPALVEMIEGLWLRSGPYVNLLFPGYVGQERGSLRAATLRALARGDAASARRSMEADVGNALDWLIGQAEGAAWPRAAGGGG